MDIVGRRTWFLSGSALVILVSVIALVTLRLNLGIDFTSGTSFELEFDGDPDTARVRSSLAVAGHGDAIVQKSGEGQFFIRTRDLGNIGIDEIKSVLERQMDFDFTVPSVTSVGQSVAQNTVRNAVVAVVVAAFFVMLYIMYAFRSIPNSYRYALAAVLALGHDVLFVLGLFAILGSTINAEVNAIFIVGILTVIGYSVNDTIVIFDRIRENVALAPTRPFAASVNISITESLVRSIITSLTTGMVIISMLLFGGETLRDFLIVLLAGVIVGTYSSLFLAAQVLVAWESGGFRWLRFWRRRRAATTEGA